MGIKCSLKCLVLAALATAWTTNAFAGGLLDEILQTYQSATLGWIKIAQGYAQTIFYAFASLSISFWGVQNALDLGNDLAGLIARFAIKIFWLAFFFTIIRMTPAWVSLITDSFIVMGKGFASSGGAVITSPSQMMEIGVNIANAMLGIWKKAASGNITSIGNDIVLGLGLVIAAFCALAGFALVALQLLITQIELSVMSAIGVVMLGFFGAPATKSFAEKYFSYLMSAGVKLMFIFALASLGQNIGDSAMTRILSLSDQGAVPIGDALGMAISILIYGILCLQIPAMASGMLSGSVSTSFGSVAGAAMAAGGAAVGAGMVLGGAAIGAKSAAGALTKLTQLTGAGNGSTASTINDLGNNFTSMNGGPGTTSSGSPSAFMSDPLAVNGSSPNPLDSAPSSVGPDSIGGAPSSPASNLSSGGGQSTFGQGMDKMNQGLSNLAASEGQSGGSVDINTGNHGH